MVRLEDIEGGLFRLVMDRKGLTQLKAILAGLDEPKRGYLHDALFDLCVEHNIGMDEWRKETKDD